MSRTRLPAGAFAGLLAATFLGGLASQASEPDALNVESTGPALADVSDLAGYASWGELTRGPHPVEPALWVLCLAPPQDVVDRLEEQHGPHLGHNIRVYGSAETEGYVASEERDFPEGTIFVKAKHILGSEDPVAVAFMIRTDAPMGGEEPMWEYRYFGGEGLTEQPTADAACAGCHERQEDGIFGSYTLVDPDAVEQQWPPPRQDSP